MISIRLDLEEIAALEKFRAEHSRPYSQPQACRLLIRDALIGMGILAMPPGGRSKWARKAARR